jgi:hypothetical protein
VEFSVSEADYGNYWGKRFNVELIDLNDVVLSFGIYRCLQEILNSWDGPTAEVRRLNEVLAPLQFCKTNEEANSAVKECLAELDATNNLYDVYSSATPTSLECTPVPTLFGSNNNERDLIFVTAPKERNQIEKTSGKVTSLYYRTLLTLVLVFPSLLSFFILDIAYKTLNIPLDTFGLGMVALSSISLCVMSLLILFFKPSKSSITAFFVVANASHLPLIYEVFLVELSLAGQLASALPVVAGLLVGIGIIYRRP